MTTSSPPGAGPSTPDGDGSSVASQAGRALGLMGGLVATAVIAGLLVAGLAVPGAVAVSRATEGTVGIFNELPADLAEQPLSQQSRILFSDGSLMATFYYQNRVVVPLDEMAEPVQQAIVDIEDSRFYEHGGVDPEGMGRAAVVNLTRGGSAQGASTLTQQWIKNTLIEKAVSKLPPSATVEERQKAALVATDSTGVSGYARKLREVKLAIAAEKKYSKKEVLERYLNIADFGDGTYGVQTASRHYFNKSAAELSLADSALLAGIVQRPFAFNPRINPEPAQQRRNVVLDRMLQLGSIDQAAHDEAFNTPIADQLSVQPSPNGCEMAQGSAYFCDYAVRNLLADPVFGKSYDERRQKLYRGGLSITTTLDPIKQRAAEGTLADRVQGNGGVSGAIVTVEPGTGRVVEMAQNSNYSTSPEAPPGSTALNFSVDKQSGGGTGFQPGSNFKPVVLATWLEQGRTLNQTVNAQFKTFPNSSWKYGQCPGSGDGRYTSAPYGPKNAEGGEGEASMSVLEATYNSVNTAYASIENQLKLCDVQDMATRLGLVNAADGAPVKVAPSMVLGTDEVAPLAVANMFATFADKGTYCRPLALDGVMDAFGNDVPITTSSCRRVIEPEIAEGVNYTLENVLTRGTAEKIGPLPGRGSAGKTGTTDKAVAAWFTGYTPNLATSVWLGYADRSKSLQGAKIGDRRYPKMYGGTLAAPVWQQYMRDAVANVEPQSFDRPPQSIIGTPPPPPKPRFTPPPRTSAPAPGPAPAPDAPPAPAAPPAGDAPPIEPPPAGDAGQPPADQG